MKKLKKRNYANNTIEIKYVRHGLRKKKRIYEKLSL